MNDKKKTLAEALTATRDSLTKENWGKGTYFQEKDGICLMCSHGAVEAQINPAVVEALSRKRIHLAKDRAFGLMEMEKGFNFSGVLATDEEIRQELIDLAADGYPVGAHFLLGLVGLDFRFNDAHDTDFAMIVSKFNLAIALAERLGV